MQNNKTEKMKSSSINKTIIKDELNRSKKTSPQNNIQQNSGYNDGLGYLFDKLGIF